MMRNNGREIAARLVILRDTCIPTNPPIPKTINP